MLVVNIFKDDVRMPAFDILMIFDLNGNERTFFFPSPSFQWRCFVSSFPLTMRVLFQISFF